MKRVIVLLSTFNGERFLQEQLDSIYEQEGVDVSVLVRDDGSSDSTCEILTENEKKGRLTWYSGENLRSAKSFMDLLMKAPEADYYAFCDQDDYWMPNKLVSAVEMMDQHDSQKPILYYSNTLLVDAGLNPLNNPIQRGPFLKITQAVISSNATGCTMCFNKVLLDMINKYRPSFQIMHDGWIHKICIALDGCVIFDATPHIKYRQHGNNVIGGLSSPSKRWKSRYSRFINGSCDRSRGIQELLNGYRDYMTDNNRNICELIANYNNSFASRIGLFFNSNIHTGNLEIDLMYRFAVLFGRF